MGDGDWRVEVGGWPVDRGGWRLEVQGGFLEEVGFDMDTKKEMDFPGRICHRLEKKGYFWLRLGWEVKNIIRLVGPGGYGTHE